MQPLYFSACTGACTDVQHCTATDQSRACASSEGLYTQVVWGADGDQQVQHAQALARHHG